MRVLTGCGLALLLFLGGCTALLYASGWIFPERTVRVRMIAEFATPQGPARFESLSDVVVTWDQDLLLDRSELDEPMRRWLDCDFGFRGQALIARPAEEPVFLIKRGHGGSDSGAFAKQLLQALGHRQLRDCKDAHETAASLGGWFGSASAELPKAAWPQIVVFRDLKDRTSADYAQPAQVGLRRVLVETSRAPLSTGIDKILPWLRLAQPYAQNPRNVLDPRMGNRTSAAWALTFSDFREDPPDRLTGREEYQRQQQQERDRWLEEKRRTRQSL